MKFLIYLQKIKNINYPLKILRLFFSFKFFLVIIIFKKKDLE